jgi:hypothetical protein
VIRPVSIPFQVGRGVQEDVRGIRVEYVCLGGRYRLLHRDGKIAELRSKIRKEPLHVLEAPIVPVLFYGRVVIEVDVGEDLVVPLRMDRDDGNAVGLRPLQKGGESFRRLRPHHLKKDQVSPREVRGKVVGRYQGDF